MSLALRPPSPAWEPISVPDLPACGVWLWVRPASHPLDVVIRLPPEVLQRLGPYLTPRRLLAAAGGHPAEVESWTAGGMMFASAGANHPALDQPCAIGPDAQIVFRLRTPQFPPLGTTTTFPPVPTAPPAHAGPVSADAERIFYAIEADWQAIEILETQLASVRKQLGTQQGKLQSLNRDLNPEERVAADNLDKKDWQDARRWLRDCAAQVSRYIREHDIGVRSAAGKRTQLEQSVRDVIVPRKSVPHLAMLQNEFEVHRKTLQVLLTAMQNTSSAAARDGEQRAQQILTRIAAKNRSRNKR